MDIRYQPHTLFNTEAEARTTVARMGLGEDEVRICVDPKGSGRAYIEVLDEDTGEVIGKL